MNPKIDPMSRNQTGNFRLTKQMPCLARKQIMQVSIQYPVFVTFTSKGLREIFK